MPSRPIRRQLLVGDDFVDGQAKGEGVDLAIGTKLGLQHLGRQIRCVAFVAVDEIPAIAQLTKVADFESSVFRDVNVVGFDVHVHKLVVVDLLESLGDFVDEEPHVVLVEWLLAFLEKGRDCAVIAQLHLQEPVALLLPTMVVLDEVGVRARLLKILDELDLADELALLSLGAQKLLGPLDGEELAGDLVATPEHSAEGALADLLLVLKVLKARVLLFGAKRANGARRLHGRTVAGRDARLLDRLADGTRLSVALTAGLLADNGRLRNDL